MLQAGPVFPIKAKLGKTKYKMDREDGNNNIIRFTRTQSDKTITTVYFPLEMLTKFARAWVREGAVELVENLLRYKH